MIHERRSKIMEIIKQNRMIKVSDLVNEYQVSIETIRRDLEYLEKQGCLRRVYGGAVIDGLYGEEPAYEHREIINFEQKKAIAAQVAEMIEDGDTLFMDVGTTVLEVAHSLQNKKKLTIITNTTLIADAMIVHDGFKVILLGGELRRGEMSTSGFLCDINMGYFFANKAIIGVGGVTLAGGISDYHMEESNTRRTMVHRSDKVIAVADYSKFGVIAMNKVCSINEISALVTDWTVPAKVVADFRAKGVTVVVAPQ